MSDLTPKGFSNGQYVDRFLLRDKLYQEDAITMGGVAILNNFPTADVVEVVRCAECVHRPTGTGVNHDVHFPSDDFTCPCHCDDSYYSWMPKDNWFCANGKR